jgi:hypothetical protein
LLIILFTDATAQTAETGPSCKAIDEILEGLANNCEGLYDPATEVTGNYEMTIWETTVDLPDFENGAVIYSSASGYWTVYYEAEIHEDLWEVDPLDDMIIQCLVDRGFKKAYSESYDEEGTGYLVVAQMYEHGDVTVDITTLYSEYNLIELHFRR